MRLLLVFLGCTVMHLTAASRQVAITFDDLPRGGDGGSLIPDLLAMFRRRGYTFVSLDQALADEAYRLPDAYAGRRGFSWIHRWSMTKGMEPKGEPEPPRWVEDACAGR